MNDDDWDVYRGISKEVDSEDENLEIKLNEVELELREADNSKGFGGNGRF